ncbi:MAG: protein-L-isoaspartate(D-aspartate) O-methyltransferase [Candidatus Nanohaloarchaea archaeon]|nr:protein-L-isoaspartate(D-aspartate) O-methyltransferase [Candidatus Nanohaloarchaea archaeon]
MSWRSTLSRLKRRGYLKSEKVEEALIEVDRSKFVPERHRDYAYSDRPLPIGEEQTISAPHMVAWMTELLDPSEDDRVLEIGTGSGYQAAVLSRLVDEVHTIERVENLYKSAQENLKDFENVYIYHRDGSKGLKDEAPFDKVIVTAAAPEVPDAWKEQLKEGGMLVVPVGEGFRQTLKVLAKKNGELIDLKSEGGVRFVPLKEGER